jgi:hypothetical protein
MLRFPYEFSFKGYLVLFSLDFPPEQTNIQTGLFVGFKCGRKLKPGDGHLSLRVEYKIGGKRQYIS